MKKRFFQSFKYPLMVFLLSRVLVFGAAGIIGTQPSTSAPRENGPVWRGFTQKQNVFLEPWRRWDALWFINVAHEGYSYRADRQSNVTVFPLYPLLLKGAAVFVRNPVAAGMVVSNVCLLLLTLLLYSMAREMFEEKREEKEKKEKEREEEKEKEDLTQRHRGHGEEKEREEEIKGKINGKSIKESIKEGEKIARGAVLILYAFPSAFLLSGVYSESLFLLLCAGSLYFGGKGKWVAAGALGVLATATRIAGVALVPVLILEYLAQRGFSLRKIRADAVFPLLVPLGILLFFLYLQLQTGDFFVYFKAQERWGHSLANPLASVAYTMNMQKNFTTVLELATALVFVSLGIIAVYRVNLSIGLFSLLIVLFSMSASNLGGLPRYALPAFGVYIAAGGILRHPVARAAAAAGLVACQLYCMILFIGWKLSF